MVGVWGSHGFDMETYKTLDHPITDVKILKRDLGETDVYILLTSSRTQVKARLKNPIYDQINLGIQVLGLVF